MVKPSEVSKNCAALLAELIPRACAACADVHFIVGGDGPYLRELHDVRRRHGLDDRVELLGAVHHADVPSVLTRGHVFLNTSLTEAFCISILEAVSCGLAVVATRVGGVPEILPAHMLRLTEPTNDALFNALEGTVADVRERPPPNYHAEVASMYSWTKVARRTERVYDSLAPRPRPAALQMLRKHAALGPVAGPWALLLIAVHRALYALLRWWRPASEIERAVDLPRTPAPPARPEDFARAPAPPRARAEGS